MVLSKNEFGWTRSPRTKSSAVPTTIFVSLPVSTFINPTVTYTKAGIYKVTLQEVVDGDATYLEFVSFIPYSKKNGLELNKAKLRGIQNMEYTPTAVTADLLQDIA